jgi:hypothetical protein
MRRHGKPCREVTGLFYLEVIRIREIRAEIDAALRERLYSRWGRNHAGPMAGILIYTYPLIGGSIQYAFVAIHNTLGDVLYVAATSKAHFWLECRHRLSDTGNPCLLPRMCEASVAKVLRWDQREEWCGRRESNPHRPFEPCGFLTDYGFRRSNDER